MSTSDSEAEIPQKAASAAAGEGFRKPSEHPTIQGFHSTIGVTWTSFFFPSKQAKTGVWTFVCFANKCCFLDPGTNLSRLVLQSKGDFFLGKTMDVFQGLFFT